jgi:hypothetical protein
MDWRDFIDVEILALVSRHVTTALACIAAALILGGAILFIGDPVLKPVIHWSETIVGVACAGRAVLIMLWELFAITRRRIKEGGSGDGTISSILV